MKREFFVISLFLVVIAFSALAGTASFSFYHEDLSQAFFDISTQFNVPIVVDQSVSGQITANLNDVNLNEALSLLCKKAGLFYFEKNGVYFVGTSASSALMKLYGYETKVLPLKYLSAEGVLSFLGEYSNYISYAQGVSLLLFSGPKEVYDRVLKILKDVDVESQKVYITYTLYEITKTEWQNGGHNFGILSELQKSNNNFMSVNFDEFFRETRHFTFKSYGFALVGTGKTAMFNVQDLGASVSVQVNSSSSSETALTVSVFTSKATATALNVKSSFKLSKGKVEIAKMESKNKMFVLELSAVKPSREMSSLANLWPWSSEEEKENFSLKSRFGYPKLDLLARYKNLAMALNVEEIYNPSFSVYVGLNGKFANDLYGYLLIGATLPATSLDNYRLKLMIVQNLKKFGALASSGYLSVDSPLNNMSNVKVDYVGNLEYEIGNFLIGGSVHYTYGGGVQSFVPYISGGLIWGEGNVVRFLYSPWADEYGGEIDFGM